MRRPLLLPALAGLALLLPAPPAGAQGIGRSAPPPTAGQARRPPPPALPGLANRRAPDPIPAENPGANLAPSEALFDSINRGDLGAAREAMARGADLNARNQLGLTPVDAAVDQGRNEIVFYLLSARGSAAGGPTFAPPEPAPAARPADRPSDRRGRGARDAAPARDARGPADADDVPVRPSGPLSDPPRGGRPGIPAAIAPVRARLFAGDGGAPRPEIGFLGFDAGQPAGAAPLAAPAGRVPSSRPAARGRRPA